MENVDCGRERDRNYVTVDQIWCGEQKHCFLGSSVTNGNRSISRYELLITLQETNGINLGAVLGGKTTCTSMIKVISNTIKSNVCAQIVQNECKISQIVDKSTFVSKKLCLIFNLRAIVDNAESLQNIFS